MSREPASATVTRWDIVLMALGAGILAGFQVGKVPPSLPVLRESLGLDFVTAGWLTSIYYAIGAAFGVAVGLLSDRAGPRRLMLMGVAFLGAGSLLGGLVSGSTWLLIARFIEGFGFVGITVTAPKLIATAARPRGLRPRLRHLGCLHADRHGNRHADRAGVARSRRLARLLARQCGIGGPLHGGAELEPASAALAGHLRRPGARLAWRARDPGSGGALALRPLVCALHAAVVRHHDVAADLPDRDSRAQRGRRGGLGRDGGGEQRPRQFCRRLADAPSRAALGADRDRLLRRWAGPPPASS